jgi:hypothetical protein
MVGSTSDGVRAPRQLPKPAGSRSRHDGLVGTTRTAHEIAECLATTSLSGESLSEVPLPDGQGATWVVDLPDGDLVSRWGEARDAVSALGLYPVAVTSWARPASDWVREDLFSRFYYGEDSAPKAVIARSQALSVDEALNSFVRDRERNWTIEHWDQIVDFQLASTERDYGQRLDRAALRNVPPGDRVALERCLLDWEETVRPTSPPEANGAFGWFDADPVGLVLLPLAEPCHAAAYLSFYGAEGRGQHDALTRLMCAWQTDFGALLVANWGTMLQFVVSSPPSTLDEAFALAVQHATIAPSTTGLSGQGIRHLARHLWRGERWFLHERP